mmetsp:Transcript_28428/g.67365  ORF Transcript_28428/g.67365 Transcript_28428/m.67365 type:complete len:304 (+) Transcript_28428:1223-2134(+)
MACSSSRTRSRASPSSCCEAASCSSRASTVLTRWRASASRSSKRRFASVTLRSLSPRLSAWALASRSAAASIPRVCASDSSNCCPSASSSRFSISIRRRSRTSVSISRCSFPALTSNVTFSSASLDASNTAPASPCDSVLLCASRSSRSATYARSRCSSFSPARSASLLAARSPASARSRAFSLVSSRFSSRREPMTALMSWFASASRMSRSRSMLRVSCSSAVRACDCSVRIWYCIVRKASSSSRVFRAFASSILRFRRSMPWFASSRSCRGTIGPRSKLILPHPNGKTAKSGAAPSAHSRL